MRLEPVDPLPTLFLRLAAWGSRRLLGGVMTPITVVYARFPKLLKANLRLLRLMESNPLDPALCAVVSTWVSNLNGCSFCEDLHKASAVRSGHADLDALREIASYESSPRFDEPTRAALAYAEEITLYKKVEDATFDRLRSHFAEEKVVVLTWFIAMTNYLNLIAVPLGIQSDGFLAKQQRVLPEAA